MSNATPARSFAAHIRLPDGLFYNGVQQYPGDKSEHLFTEMDSGPSHGATFGIDVETLVRKAIDKRRLEKRAQFGGGSSSPVSGLRSPVSVDLNLHRSNHE